MADKARCFKVYSYIGKEAGDPRFLVEILQRLK